MVGVRRSNHYGAAGYYAMRAARAGLIGLSTTNADPLVIPFGGRDAALGTNPIAFAAPLPDGVFCLDMATSQVAINRIFNARDDGRPIPEGWGVDAEGRATTDAAAVAAAVPLGGYKGYGLAIMVEVLSGVLTGAGVGHGIGALYGDAAARAGRRPRPPRARPGAAGRRGALRRAARRSCWPALSGERPGAGLRGGARAGRARGARGRASASEHGIPLPPFVWNALREAGEALGVASPDAVLSARGGAALELRH